MELRELSESIIRIADQCKNTDHSFCGGSEACDDFRQFVAGPGQDFDAGRLLLNHGDDWPDRSWSTAALLRLVSEAIDGRESKRSRWRTIRLTSALARLGERGLGADMVLRTWLGQRLIRHALTELVIRYYVNDPSLSGGGPFTPWAKILDDEVNEDEGVRPVGLSQLMLVANGGSLKKLAREWCETAAVSHLVDYRVSEYIKTDVEQSDLVFQAGEDATVWIFDRLTMTYLSRWSAKSLMWELTYINRPFGVVECLGVSASILAERRVSMMEIMDELSNRLLDRGDLIEEARCEEVHEQVISLLRDSDYDGALDLARRTVRKSPRDARYSLILACCLMVSNPLDAIIMLEQIRQAVYESDERLYNDSVVAAVFADLATAYLLEGRLDKFDYLMENIEGREFDGWFWDPCEYVQGSLVFRYFRHSERIPCAKKAKESIGIF